MKIDNDIYFAEISKSVYMANSSQHDNFQIHSSNYTATTILEIQKSFLNSSFSVLEFLNNEENRKLLRKQQEESNYI